MAGATLVVLLGACYGDGDEPAGAPAPTGETATSAPAGGAEPAAKAISWQRKADAPAPRQEVAAAVAEERVWVLGGLTAAGASARVDVYDLAADRWERGPDLPVAVHHAMAATFRGEVVLAGGFLASSGDLYAAPSDRVFALRNGAWVELPRLARGRGAGAAAVAGDRLVVVGGRDIRQLVAPTELFDRTGWRDGAPIPEPRDHVAASADDRFVYAVGGRRLSPAATSADLERYDPVANRWETLPSMPTARGGLGAAVVAGRLVAAGGEDASRVFSEVESFDLRAGRWSSLPPMTTPRHGLGGAAVGSTFVAPVGGAAAGVGPSAVNEVLPFA